jgi:hypothetical protein
MNENLIRPGMLWRFRSSAWKHGHAAKARMGTGLEKAGMKKAG